ncbi:MAG: hypothetical protein D6732_02120 [Methanobacteriota archaeon]|nr:MAG: hypothetical protein D6732_02120 [Euryarchaeota archaeon]
MVLIRNDAWKYGYKGPKSIDLDPKDHAVLVAAKELADLFQTSHDYIITLAKSPEVDLDLNIFPFPLVLGLKKEKSYRIRRVTMTGAMNPIFPDIWQLEQLKELKLNIWFPFYPDVEPRERPLDRLIVKLGIEQDFNLSCLVPVRQIMVRMSSKTFSIHMRQLPRSERLIFHGGRLIALHDNGTRALKVIGNLTVVSPLYSVEQLEIHHGNLLTPLPLKDAFPNFKSGQQQISSTDFSETTIGSSDQSSMVCKNLPKASY